MNKKFYLFLSVITAARLAYAALLPLAPQEAYYWNYSRHLALSYFDHPPMAAYFIKLTTLLGTSAFSIHLAAIALSVILTMAIYRLAALLFDEWVGFWSAIVINIVFIYALGALIITPDNPMLLFWVLSMIACVQISRGGGWSWWILLGIFLGAGFDSKYPIVFAGLGALLFFLSSRERRRWFATSWPYVSLIVAFIVTLPVIYWNYTHDWASFAFQTSRRTGEMTRVRWDYFFGYIGTVLGIYGVAPFPLLFAGTRYSLKRFAGSANHMLIVVFSLPMLLFLTVAALRSWVKMNWTAPAFIILFIAAVAYYRDNASAHRWVQIWGKVCIVFLLAVFLVIHLLVPLPNFYFGRGDYFAGWSELAAEVEKVRPQMPAPYFIIGSEYKISSELAFHLDGKPETVGNNVLGIHALQYDYWARTDTLVGRDAIYVSDCQNCDEYISALKNSFTRVTDPEIVTAEKGGKKLRNYYIYRCYDYIGKGL